MHTDWTACVVTAMSCLACLAGILASKKTPPRSAFAAAYGIFLGLCTYYAMDGLVPRLATVIVAFALLVATLVWRMRIDNPTPANETRLRGGLPYQQIDQDAADSS